MKICISKSYETKKVFDGLTIDVTEGEILCVLGESGCGKTTLLNILAGFTSYKGELFGVPEKVGYIFQEPRLLPNLTVAQNLAYAGGRVEVIEELLEIAGLSGFKNKRPKSLSGGEKQRVAIVRAFASGAKVLLLDEPFSSLDTAMKIRLLDAFATLWKRENVTAVAVTHDIEEALTIAHRIVVLKDGKVIFDRVLDREVPAKYGAFSPLRDDLLNALTR
jgi:NitT/TauT family transport system ATP-binding protein